MPRTSEVRCATGPYLPPELSREPFHASFSSSAAPGCFWPEAAEPPVPVHPHTVLWVCLSGPLKGKGFILVHRTKCSPSWQGRHGIRNLIRLSRQSHYQGTERDEHLQLPSLILESAMPTVMGMVPPTEHTSTKAVKPDPQRPRDSAKLTTNTAPHNSTPYKRHTQARHI